MHYYYYYYYYIIKVTQQDKHTDWINYLVPLDPGRVSCIYVGASQGP